MVSDNQLFDISDALRWEVARMGIWSRGEYSTLMQTRLLALASQVEKALPPAYEPTDPVVRHRVEARRRTGARALPKEHRERLDWLLGIRDKLQGESQSASPSRRKSLRAAAGVASEAIAPASYNPDRKVRSSGAPLAPHAPRAKRVR